MKKVVVILIICFAINGVKAQHRYLDNNPVWVIHEFNVPPNPNCIIDGGNIYYYLKGDTVLGGYTYHKVFRKELYEYYCPPSAPTYYGSNDTIHPYTYLRDTLKQIRQWAQLVGGDSLLYDFNLSIGDALHSHFGNFGINDTCGYTVTAIDSIPVSNYYRKRFTFTMQFGVPIYLAEGIGWDATFLDPVIFCPNVSTQVIYNLTCYGVNDTAWYPNYNAISPCTVPNFTIGIKENQKPLEEILISPNPFTSQTTISFSSEQKNTKLKVINLLGEMVFQSKIQNQISTSIDLSNLANGIYFMEFQTENCLFRKKIVKQ